jgi:hypothetical protein
MSLSRGSDHTAVLQHPPAEKVRGGCSAAPRGEACDRTFASGDALTNGVSPINVPVRPARPPRLHGVSGREKGPRHDHRSPFSKRCLGAFQPRWTLPAAPVVARQPLARSREPIPAAAPKPALLSQELVAGLDLEHSADAVERSATPTYQRPRSEPREPAPALSRNRLSRTRQDV